MDCEYCKKSFKYQSKWIRHCETKKHIKKVCEAEADSQKLAKVSQVSQKVSQVSQKVSQKLAKVSQEEKQPGLFLGSPIESFYGYCKYCDKGFKHKSSLSKHQNHRCSERPQQGTTIINNNYDQRKTQVIHQHVHINVYGKEDFSSIMDDKMYNILKELEGIPMAQKMITHMYNVAPNNTVQITNMNQPYCLTMGEDNTWEKHYLPPIIEEIRKQLPRNTRKMFTQYYKQTKHEYDNLNDWIKSKKEGNRIINELKEMCKDKTQKKAIENIIKATLYNNNNN